MAFDLLNQHRKPDYLWLSPNLVVHEVCVGAGTKPTEQNECNVREEYFVSGTEPTALSSAEPTASENFGLVIPTPGLTLAVDPRVPGQYQKLEFLLTGVNTSDRVVWQIDDDCYETSGPTFLWSVVKGTHQVAAELHRANTLIARTQSIKVIVH